MWALISLAIALVGPLGQKARKSYGVACRSGRRVVACFGRLSKFGFLLLLFEVLLADHGKQLVRLFKFGVRGTSRLRGI